jgi:hypothetical protein
MMNESPALERVVCLRLRSKGAGAVYGEPLRWENGFYPNATFWCLLTADAIGPDDGFVHPHVCTIARACFHGSDVSTP